MAQDSPQSPVTEVQPRGPVAGRGRPPGVNFIGTSAQRQKKKRGRYILRMLHKMHRMHEEYVEGAATHERAKNCCYCIMFTFLAVGNITMGTILAYSTVLTWLDVGTTPDPSLLHKGHCLVMCYFEPRSVLRGNWSYDLRRHFPSKNCTHVLYSDLVYSTKGSVLTYEHAYIAVNKKALETFMEESRSHGATILAELRCNSADDLLALEQSAFEPRKLPHFVSNVSRHLLDAGFQGLDVNVYNPASGTGNVRDKYPALLQALRDEFQKHNLLLSANVYVTHNFTQVMDYAKIWRLVDIMVVNTHNLTQATNSTGVPSPLYSNKRHYSWESTLNIIANATRTHDRLVASVAFTGSEFKLEKPVNASEQLTHRLPALGYAEGTNLTYRRGMLAYFEICTSFKKHPWFHAVDFNVMCPVAGYQERWIGYDDAWSIAEKVRFARRENLHGVAVRHIDKDDFLGNCGPKNPLMTSLLTQMTDCRMPT